MNQRLADFLFDLLRNPEKLRRFNTEEGREEILVQGLAAGALTDADVAALRGESEDVLIRLQASVDDLMWVVGPGIKPPLASALIGWGIKPRSEPALRKPPAPTSRKGGMVRKSTTTRSKKGGAAGKSSKAPARKRKGGKR